MKRHGLGLLLLLIGCGGVLHRVDQTPPPPVEPPSVWAGIGTATSTTPYDGQWWSTFGSPTIDGLVEEAFDRSPTLGQAFARLRQAQAGVKTQRSGFFPTITADATVNSNRNVSDPAAFGQMGDPFSNTITTTTLQASAQYEVDVWGRIAHAYRGARADFRATEAEVESAAMTLAATVVDTYLQLAEQRANFALVQEQLEVSETYLELVEFRFDQGVSSGLDVFQQRQQLASTRNLLPTARQGIELLEHQLSVLLGQPPGQGLPSVEALPDLPPMPEAGIPSAVLLQRPDVKAALERVVGADHRVGSAIAAQLPALNLAASVGTRGFPVSALFEEYIRNLTAGLTGTLFAGGRLRAEVERNRGLLEEQLAAYAQVVLTALRELEDALSVRRAAEALVASIETELEAAVATLEEARLRYGNGLAEYLPVLEALRAQQETQRRLLTARRQLLSAQVELHRALGGTWAADIENPSLADGGSDSEGSSS
ncbi:MAG: efflux transporter outer membrane subunit [Myxococcota bacterium]